MGFQADKLFINLPVKDLNRAIAFFTSLDFAFDPQYTDDNASCMIVNEHCNVMLLVEEFYQSFIQKPVADASKSSEMILSILVANKEEVDRLVKKALAVGATIANDPVDMGFSYQWSFQDTDGHQWEFFCMMDVEPEQA